MDPTQKRQLLEANLIKVDDDGYGNYDDIQTVDSIVNEVKKTLTNIAISIESSRRFYNWRDDPNAFERDAKRFDHNDSSNTVTSAAGFPKDTDLINSFFSSQKLKGRARPSNLTKPPVKLGDYSSGKSSSMLLKQWEQELEKEFNDYLSKPPLDELLEPDLLTFWKTQRSNYPMLATVARVVFASPSSSIGTERAFSLSRLLVGLRRHSLSPHTLSDLMTLKINKDLVDPIIPTSVDHKAL